MFYARSDEAVALVKTGKYVFTGRKKESSSFFFQEDEYELSEDINRANNIWLPKYEAIEIARKAPAYTIIGDRQTSQGKEYELTYNG